MKVRINESGDLEFYRKNEFRRVGCPFDPSGQASCGDWCALFDEPKKVWWQDDFVELSLCRKTYTIPEEDFEDLRGA